MEVIKARYKLNETVRRRRPSVKVLTAAVGIVLIMLAGGGYSFLALKKTPPVLGVVSVTPTPRPPDVISMPWLHEGQAAIGTLEDGVLAVSTTSEQPKPIASMTKVVTALAVLKSYTEAVNYTITATDVGHYQSYAARGGSVVAVREGQVLNREQALEALLLASANNIADSLVDWHFGTMEAFTAYANKMVQEYGLKHTTIADASGFSPQTQSTPSDLLILAQKAMAQPEIAKIVALRTASIPGLGEVRNTNRLLSEPGVIGIKTGTTDEAGNCLLFAAVHDLPSGKKVTLIGVVMGASNAAAVFSNSKSLLAAAGANYGEVEVIPAGTEVGSFTSAWGQTTKLVTAESLRIDTWKGKQLALEVALDTAGNAVLADQIVGKAKVGAASVGVKAENTVGLPSNLWRLGHYW